MRRSFTAGAARLLVVGLTAAVLLAIPQVAGAYLVNIVILAAFAVVLATGYRVLLLAGRASLCHGTFYALGAYTFAVMTTKTSVGVWPSLALGGVVAALGALLIGLPALRTAGAYFFLMTFAFYMVVTSLLENFSSLTGGFGGISSIPALPGISTLNDYYYVAVGLGLACVLAFYVIDRSRWGLELRALGSAPDLARAVGVNSYWSMLAAFALGASSAGIAGGVYASYSTFVAPESFTLWTSVAVLTYVIVGGARYFSGAIVGALFIVVVPALADWSPQVNVLFGAGIVLIVMFIARHGVVTTCVAAWRRRDRTRRERAASWIASLPELDPADQPAPAAPDGEPLLVAEGLRRSFGGVRAVEDVSLTVARGRVTGVVGPNGSGKSTSFDLITGFREPDAGDVVFDGRSITRMSAHRIVRRGLGRSFQASVVFDQMTVFENVLVAASASWAGGPFSRLVMPIRHQREPMARARAALELVGLERYAFDDASDLPYGLKKSLGLAIALATAPQLVCLDEPAAGMTNAEAEELVFTLKRVQDESRVSILITEHRVSLISRLCDHVLVLHDGHMIAEGSPADVFADAYVQKAYLGIEGGKSAVLSE